MTQKNVNEKNLVMKFKEGGTVQLLFSNPVSGGQNSICLLESKRHRSGKRNLVESIGGVSQNKSKVISCGDQRDQYFPWFISF